MSIRETITILSRTFTLMLSFDRKRIGLLVLISIVVPALNFASSAVYALCLNTIQQAWGAATVPTQIYPQAALAFALFPLLSGIVHDFEWYIASHVRLITDREVSLWYSRNMSARDPAQFDDRDFNALKTRVDGAGLWKIQHTFDDALPIIQELATALLAVSAVVSASWWFLPVLMIGVAPRVLLGLRHAAWAYSIWSASTDIRLSYGDLNWRFSSGTEVAKMHFFGYRNFLLNRAADLHARFHADEVRKVVGRFRGDITARLCSESAVAVCVGACLVEVIPGAMSIGTFTFFTMSIGRFAGSAGQISSRWGRIAGELRYLSDLFRLIDAPSFLPRARCAQTVDQRAAPTIQLQDVHFTYPGISAAESLSGVALTVQPGEKIAIVGKNGAGKSTLLRLLLRVYDPTRGKILINGVDLRELELSSWYQHLGTYIDGGPRFALTIQENIALGAIERAVDRDAMEAACRAMQSDAFIKALPLGYDSVLGRTFPNGIELSWGQLQRLSLSQLLYRAPRILLLDEPTSGLDPLAEQALFEKLLGLSELTLIFVSHRFSTVRRASRILVIDEGKIAEDGDHATLMSNSRLYAQLFLEQAKGYQAE